MKVTIRSRTEDIKDWASETMVATIYNEISEITQSRFYYRTEKRGKAVKILHSISFYFIPYRDWRV